LAEFSVQSATSLEAQKILKVFNLSPIKSKGGNMKKISFFAIFFGIICFPAVFYGQVNSMDRFNAQQQSERFNQYKKQIKKNAQEGINNANRVIRENTGAALEYKDMVEAGGESLNTLTRAKQQNGAAFYLLFVIPIILMAVVSLLSIGNRYKRF